MGGNWPVSAVQELRPHSGRLMGTDRMMQGRRSYESSSKEGNKKSRPLMFNFNSLFDRYCHFYFCCSCIPPPLLHPCLVSVCT